MAFSLPSLRRLLGFTTALSLAVPVFAPASHAQDADSGSAPPARVGQINGLSGTVSFDGSGSGGWAAAADNYPVTAGDSLYTQDGSRAGIALDASQITLSSDTEFEVTSLDDTSFAATLSQGEAAFAINDLQPGQTFNISTPRGNVSIDQNGQYDIEAGDANTPTTVNVFQGEATVTDPGVNLQVDAGQSVILTGTDQTVAQLGQAQEDSFTSAVLAQNNPTPAACPPAVCGQMTGVSELSQYGSWQQTQQYGAVWYPSVSSGWVPYRDGHWAYIAPWGWTWVSAEPWGFAPSHYGRWVDDGGRWGWAPAPAYDASSYGPSYVPVYAPAVVTFFGAALAAGITAAALSSGSIGWVPLAPNEPYYPPYHAPAAYIRRINVVNVRNINDIHITNNYYYGNNLPPTHFANHGAATFVPANVMSHGERVASYAHAPSPQELAAARPIDTGFGQHPTGKAAAFRLPQANPPLAALHPAAAPHPSAFAQRHSLPPARLSQAPAGHPEAGAAMHGPTPPATRPGSTLANRPGFAPADRPGFATAPGFHAPPAPPAPVQHLGALPPGNFRPEATTHAAPGFAHPEENAVIHPQAEQHPGAVPGFRPAPEASHPAETHPPAEMNRPAEINHPQEHAPAPAFHPAPADHAPAPFHAPEMAPRPEAAPRPEPAPRPMEAPHAAPPHPEAAHGQPDRRPNG